MKTAKLIAFVFVASLFLTACGGESFDENQVRSPKEFYDLYVEGWSMIDDGNLELDGKKVTIEGKIEDRSMSTRNKVSGTVLKFINLEGDKPFAAHGINAMFTGANEEKAKALKVGDKVKFQGTVGDYVSMDKALHIENAVIK